MLLLLMMLMMVDTVHKGPCYPDLGGSDLLDRRRFELGSVRISLIRERTGFIGVSN